MLASGIETCGEVCGAKLRREGQGELHFEFMASLPLFRLVSLRMAPRGVAECPG